ncbi:PEP-CTERM protein-sorting domain-containing protein [Nitrosospira briensis]|uniref:PEP-CTERM protein-sorting domain-containing protein n=1 Tax=Nitrosospira briensis TaxID=35799 RepID=A0A1I5BH17_9PROT|nr:PEP-CTERM sorting domain-containing protein [Nitrosospira briensis]SFN74034.1 PEP-CTERM protein-sorting domain-containing protein [Nitrosospira briensis]
MILSHCFKICNLVLTLIAGLSFVTHATAQSVPYLIDTNNKTWTRLDLGSGGYASALNDAGQVTGSFYTSAGPRAFITGPDGMGIREIANFPEPSNYVIRSGDVINNAGRVAGQTLIPSWVFQGPFFVTGPNGTDPKTVSEEPGVVQGRGNDINGINDAGQVVGSRILRDGSLGFMTGPNGEGLNFIGDLGGESPWGDKYIDATSINNTGQVVGASLVVGGGSHAFITGPNGVGITDLGTLGGDDSYATGINDAGQVVGDSRTVADATHAFITGPNGVGMTDLGTLGGDYSTALGINDAGQVVGWYSAGRFGEGERHAFITGVNGEGMTDLSSLVDLPQGVVLTEAIDINNNGQVIARASIVPEPETYALMLAGLGLLGLLGGARSP